MKVLPICYLNFMQLVIRCRCRTGLPQCLLVSWAFSRGTWQKFSTAPAVENSLVLAPSHVFFPKHALKSWRASSANVARTFRCYTDALWHRFHCVTSLPVCRCWTACLRRRPTSRVTWTRSTRCEISRRSSPTSSSMAPLPSKCEEREVFVRSLC